MELLSYTDFDIKKEYNRLNNLLFNNDLPTIPLEWNTSIQSGGLIEAKVNRYTGLIPNSLKLKLSKKYQREYNDWINILLHEMIHIKNIIDGHYKDNHGAFFHLYMKKFNSMGYNVQLTTSILTFSPEFKKNVGVILFEKLDSGYSLMTVKKDLIKKWYENLLADTKLKQYYYKSAYFLISNDLELLKFPLRYKLNAIRGYKIDKQLFDKLKNQNEILYVIGN
jgi:hypothetical protein